MCALSIGLLSSQLTAIELIVEEETRQKTRPLLEDFYNSPSSHLVTLSPDGKKVAWIYALDNKTLRHLMVLDLETNKKTRLLSAPNIKRPVWQRSSESIYVLTNTSLVRLPLADSVKKTTIMRFDEAKNQAFEKYDPRLDLLYYSEEDDNSHRIFSLSPKGQSTLLLASEEKISHFYHYPNIDALFFSLHFTDHIEILAREHGKVRRLTSCDIVKNCRLLGVDIDKRELFIDSNAQTRLNAIASLNLDTQQETVLLSDPQGISDREYSVIREGKHVYSSFFGDYKRFYSPIASVQATFEHLRRTFPNKNLNLQLSEDKSRWLLEVYAGNMQLSSFYHYIPENRKLVDVTNLIEKKTVKISEANLAEPTPLTYKGRDGLSIQSYVWLPKNTDLQNAPLIAFIHGGPWNRLKGEYDFMTQILVSNGYIVFQPNFRASTGFGVDFTMAADKTFGKGKPHNDIIDGIETLLESGIGNRDKLGIVGHSFGGFSVLGALAFEPDYFKVGFATAAPSQMPRLNSAKTLKKMGRKKPQRGKDRIHRDRVFLIDERDQAELDRLYSISPDAHKMAIKTPLIMAAGAKDRKVAVADIKSYAMALKLAEKPVSLFIDKHASHSFNWDTTWSPLMYLLERFLAEHLSGHIHIANDNIYQKKLLKMEAFSTSEVKQHFYNLSSFCSPSKPGEQCKNKS